MKEINELVKAMKKESLNIQKYFEIALLTNSRTKTRIINNQSFDYSDNNEFFSDIEFSEILEGIQSAGFYVKPYFNEISFIVEMINDACYKNNKIVYNLSRNGNFIGKKSLIPSFCDLLSLPYTGSNALVTSLCRAKYTYLKYFESHDINITKSWVLSENNTWFNQEKPPYGIKIVTKPMHESASIGLDMNSIFIFDRKSEQELLAKQSFRNVPLLLQEFIEGYECEVPFFVTSQVHLMAPVGISINNNSYLGESILTFERSFNDDYGFYTLSDELEYPIIKEIEETSKKIAELIGFNDYGRIDYRIDNKGVPHLMDIATSPYTTKHSSFAYSFDMIGLNYSDIYTTIIGLAYSRNNLEDTKLK